MLVLERDTLGSGATGKSSGIIRQNYEDPVLAKMACDSLQVYRNFGQSIGGDAEFRNTGYMVASNDAERLESRVKRQSAMGIRIKLLRGTEAKELEPEAAIEDGASFSYEEEAGVANATSTLLSFAREAKRLGVTVRERTPVSRVSTSNGKVNGVALGGLEYSAPAVLIAAGAWSGRVAKMAGVSIPVKPVIRYMVKVGVPNDMRRPKLVLLDETTNVYVLPEGERSNSLMLGGGAETHSLTGTDEGNPDDFISQVPEEVKMDRVRKAAVRYPKLMGAPIAGGYTGIVDYTPDKRPILSEVEGVEGLYFACGSSSHGFKLSPVVGKGMAELIINGATASIDIDHFSLRRFGDTVATRA